jgi:hypothetical protein
MKFMQGVFLLCLCLLIAFGACRRNQPSLVDTNEPPDTHLWYSPPDSSEYEYKVHLYWRGVDADGTAVRFIWTIQDTLVEGELSWNPNERLRDFREGRIISSTDSVFSFTAFRDVGGVGVKKNRQAFYIAAIDDAGAIDPDPAAIEFVATIDQLPRMTFSTHIAGHSEAYVNVDIPQDTVGVLEPFRIGYHGVTTNGLINAYKFFPLTTGVFLDGQDEWSEILTDTLQDFKNDKANLIPSGVFKFAAQCRDDADAESPVDAGSFTRGVCRIVVNYDPDTDVNNVRSSYTVDDEVIYKNIVWYDGVPDTVPYNSWVRLEYTGWDDPRDGKIACDDLKPDSCIGFQVAYWKESVYEDAASEFSLWQPREGVHDSDCESSTDSNSFHVGSLEYEFYVRSVDEHARPDGTPPSVQIIGNYRPTLDSLAVEDHLGNRINLAVLDTVTWNFWKGEGWPYTCSCDTVLKPPELCGSGEDFSCRFKEYLEHGTTFDYYKRWSVHIKAWGHDNPDDPTPTNKDPQGSGVKSWWYTIRNAQGQYVSLGHAQKGFFDEVNDQKQFNALDEIIRYRVGYPGPYNPNHDPMGDTVFANLPAWMGKELTVVLKGRDTPKTSAFDFEQSVFIRRGCESDLRLAVINVFPDASVGRHTQEKTFVFVIRLVR